MKLYRIRDNETGLFSHGNGFNVNGKFWFKINHVKCHIKTTMKRIYEGKDISIIEYEMIESKVTEIKYE